MLGIIAIVIGMALAAILIYATTRANNFRVERSLKINASPDRLFAMVNNLRSWAGWSPFEKLDPAMKKSFSGPESGPGAASAWEGNSKAGAGRMEIVSAVPNSKVIIKLDFLKPFKTHNTGEFTFEPVAGATKVTWAMSGPQNYMCKLMSIFMNMDKMIGKEFEAGLGNLKGLTESAKTVKATV